MLKGLCVSQDAGPNGSNDEEEQKRESHQDPSKEAQGKANLVARDLTRVDLVGDNHYHPCGLDHDRTKVFTSCCHKHTNNLQGNLFDNDLCIESHDILHKLMFDAEDTNQDHMSNEHEKPPQHCALTCFEDSEAGKNHTADKCEDIYQSCNNKIEIANRHQPCTLSCEHEKKPGVTNDPILTCPTCTPSIGPKYFTASCPGISDSACGERCAHEQNSDNLVLILGKSAASVANTEENSDKQFANHTSLLGTKCGQDFMQLQSAENNEQVSLTSAIMSGIGEVKVAHKNILSDSRQHKCSQTPAYVNVPQFNQINSEDGQSLAPTCSGLDHKSNPHEHETLSKSIEFGKHGCHLVVDVCVARFEENTSDTVSLKSIGPKKECNKVKVNGQVLHN